MNDDELIEKIEYIIEFGGTYQGNPSNIKDAHEIKELIDKHRHQQCIEALKSVPECAGPAAHIEAIEEVFNP